MFTRIKSFVFFLFLAQGTFASFDFNASCKEAYADLLALKMEKGRSLLEAEKKLHPENRIVYWLENYCDFLTLIITEEKDRYRLLEKNRGPRLDAINSGEKDSPWYLYCKAEINLQWAFVEVKFGEYKGAALDINKAWHLLEDNEKKYPGFLPSKKCVGLLHTLVGSIPDNYKWAIALIGMNGTVREGITELQEVLDRTSSDQEFSWLRTETLFYLSFIQLNLNNDGKEQDKIFENFISHPPREPLLVYAAAGLAIHTGRGEQALVLLGGLKEDATRLPFYYLGYLKGVALMNKLDTGASKYFREYLRQFKGMNFIRSAYRNLAWCSLLSGNEEGYRRNMKLVMVNGNNMTDEDKQALKDAKEEELPEINLLRSRLLFDGGYYQEALRAVLKTDPGHSNSFHDIIEFEYRLARIHHRMGDIATAISYYRITFEAGKKYSFYFAANSALQLGLIYEAQGNKEQALAWFKQCLSLRDHEYQDSIDLKAKAGLSRLQ